MNPLPRINKLLVKAHHSLLLNFRRTFDRCLSGLPCSPTHFFETLRLCVSLLALLLLPGIALATQTDNRGLHAVPAPGPVTIDGKLTDWDLSGQTMMCYDLETLSDIYSARVALMYDRANLYVAIHWKDRTPMGNSHNPRYQANKAWAGDSVQLRIMTDRISHVTAWYYAADKEPSIQIDYGKSLTDPYDGGSKQLFRTDRWKLQEGAEMAFLQDADGKGYVQEIKLPWKLITLSKQYRAGEKINCGFELLWGEEDWPVHRYSDNLMPGTSSREFFWTAYNSWGEVLLEPKGNLKLPEPLWMKSLRPAPMQGPVAIHYRLPYDSRVTLAIEDAKTGKRIRNLISYLSRTAGANTERWDGLDDEGKPVQPGTYTYKALYHKGIHASWLMSFANPGNPTWSTADGHGAFYGDHTAPQAVAAAGDYVALACPMGEAGQPIIGCDLNGQRLWGLANRAAFDGGHISLATDGKTLWIASEGKRSLIYRAEMATGKYAPWNALTRESGSDFRVLDLPVSDLPGYGADPKLGVNLSAIALNRGTLAVCLTRENKIKLLESDTGRVKAELNINAPRAVVYRANGELIVLSGSSLIIVSADGSTRPFTDGSFPQGYGLAIDAEQNVYLTLRGQEQNVRIFTPEGALRGEIGSRGGRPLSGPYSETSMRNPAGMAIDSKGRLWVTEETLNPKRTSIWSLDGKLLKDLAGTTSYAGAGAINPFDSTMAFSDNTVYQIDLDKGTYRPVYSFAKTDDPDEIFPLRVDSHVRIISHAGITHVYCSSRTSEVSSILLKDGKWLPGASVGVCKDQNDSEVPINFAHPFFKGHKDQIYSWADSNGDGIVQPEELKFATPELDGKPVHLQNYYWGSLPDTDGTITFVARDSNALFKYPITGWNAAGAPTYDVANPQIIRLPAGATGGNGEGMSMGGSEGRVYLNQDPVISLDRNGKILGSYPSHFTSVHGSHNAHASRPGYLIGPSSILGTAQTSGEAGEVFYMNGNLGENYLFTSDGLLIQSLFKDTRGWFETPARAVRGVSFDATTAGGESFGGSFTRLSNGKYVVTLGGTDAHVLELTGIDSVKRFKGEITYSKSQYLDALRLARARAAQTEKPKTYLVGRIASHEVTGKHEGWPHLSDDSASVIEIQESSQQRYGRVEARYDDNNLYLAYRVFSPNGAPHNGGQNEKLLFKTGDCVDLMVGPSKLQQDAGCLRMLMTMMGGKPIAVLNQKAAPGANPKDRYEFSSPWRTIAFDRVVIAPDVKIASSPIQGGYFVEAAIPWKRIGVVPHPGLKLKADFGVLFADSSGATTIARQYWSNKATGLVNDVPGEADLEADLWGEIELGK